MTTTSTPVGQPSGFASLANPTRFLALTDRLLPRLWAIGAAFTFMCLVTGALWGRPMWGTYWIWDARLTSVLVLFLMYLGIMALQRTMDDPGRAARATAILTLVGVVNIPIIRFSVDWWNTLHQPASVARLDGPTIHPSILIPLLVMAFGFRGIFAGFHRLVFANRG